MIDNPPELDQPGDAVKIADETANDDKTAQLASAKRDTGAGH